MLNSVLLDVFIGMALIYVLLSLVVASILEAFAGITKMRNSLLESAMRAIIGSEKYVNLFYHHPVISSFKRKPFFLSVIYRVYSWRVSRILRISWFIEKCNFVKLYHIVSMGRPSYLSSKIFSLVLFDFIRGGFDGIKRRYAPITVNKKGNGDELVFEFDQHEVYRREEVEAWLLKFNYFIEMAGIIEKTTTEDTTLSSIIAEREPVLDRIADWFDLQMERVTGVYKRKTQAILFVVSFVICSVLNADTIMMANILWTDPVMRNAVVYEATKTVADASQANEATGPNAHELNRAMAADNPCTECGKLTAAEVAAKENRMRPFPIGWGKQTSSVFREYRTMPENFKGFLYKCIGILLTTFLISLGSPFWFDLLSKIVNIRNVGLKPRTTAVPAGNQQKDA